jgi:predicted double-glycine peptidase
MQFPFFKQQDQMDCGPTCLRMIAKFHGRNFKIQTLRHLCEFNREGVSLLGISDAAEKIGFRSLGAKLTVEEVRNAELPCILHWQQNHFVVLYKIKGGNFYIADPGRSCIKLSLSAKEKAETQAELRDAESKYLSKQSPLLQTEAALLSAGSTYEAKQKEIFELNNQVIEERSRFIQALNSLISQAEEWKSKYILTASQSGKVVFAGIIQQNLFVQSGQEVFYINPGKNTFYGEMAIPQFNMGKVKEGQQVILKLRSYPYEEYGVVKGIIQSINEIPYKDSIFLSKVILHLPNDKHLKRKKKVIKFKQGMLGNAEIVTKDATVLERIVNSFVKMSDLN